MKTLVFFHITLLRIFINYIRLKIMKIIFRPFSFQACTTVRNGIWIMKKKSNGNFCLFAWEKKLSLSFSFPFHLIFQRSRLSVEIGRGREREKEEKERDERKCQLPNFHREREKEKNGLGPPKLISSSPVEAAAGREVGARCMPYVVDGANICGRRADGRQWKKIRQALILKVKKCQYGIFCYGIATRCCKAVARLVKCLKSFNCMMF